MEATSPRLYGVPRPLRCESPASWVQRVCQRYDLTYSKFLACIGKRAANDIDLALQPENYLALSNVCGIEFAAFDLMRRSLGRCAWMRELQELVSFREKQLPLYRFCHLCWRADKIPFLRLEWRFARWTMCPTHGIPMSDRCSVCLEPLQMQRAMLGGASRVVASLAYCYCCGSDMRLGSERQLANDVLTVSAQAINTQRAIVSAVAHGYFFIDGLGERALPVKRLPLWVRHDVLEGIGAAGLLATNSARAEELFAESREFDSRLDSMLERRTCHPNLPRRRLSMADLKAMRLARRMARASSSEAVSS